MKYLNYLAVVAVFGLFSCNIMGKDEVVEETETPEEIDIHSIVVEEVTGIGKLELSHYKLKDVVEHSSKQLGGMVEAKKLMVVSGEAAACIDLTKIQASDVEDNDSVLILHLPAPELCYYKVDLKNSRTVTTSQTWLADKDFDDALFKKAEEQIKKAVEEVGYEEDTKKYATQILKPLLQSISNKTVVLKFAEVKVDEKSL